MMMYFSKVWPGINRGRNFAMPRLLVALSALVLWAGCATTPKEGLAPLSAEPTVVHEPIPPEPEGYETPPAFVAGDVSPVPELETEAYTIVATVQNDGRLNHYWIETPFGDFAAIGDEVLPLRVREATALTRLDRMTRAKAGGHGAAAGLKKMALSPFRQVKKVLLNPLYLVGAVPSDLMSAIALAKDTAQLIRRGFNMDAVKDYVGYYDAKKGLAVQLGIEEDTPNVPLQEALSSDAWGYWAGTFPVRAVDRYVPGLQLPRIELIDDGGASLGRAIDILMNEINPKTVKKRLKRMDVPKDVRKEFRSHPHYTGRTRGMMVAALWELPKVPGRVELVELATTAASYAEGRKYRRQAEVLAGYHDRYAEIAEVLVVDGAVGGLSAQDDLVVPVYADYFVWTRLNESAMEAAAALLPDDGVARDVEVFLTGEMSDMARAELYEDGLAVFEDSEVWFFDPYHKTLKERVLSPREEAEWYRTVRRNNFGKGIPRD